MTMQLNPLVNQNLDISTRESMIQSQVSQVKQIYQMMEKVIVGQDQMVQGILLALLTGGHCLLEGVPGIAKTTAVKTFAKTMELDYQRIQFTPDLLPGDLTGTLVYDPKQGDFYIRKGPVFANLVLADEINRAPAKVQSALLEAMEEKHVTIGNQTLPIGEPFHVLATQNPIEQEGTYSLPEAQMDRFMFKLLATYPDADQELEILQRNLENTGIEIQPTMHRDQVLELRQAVSLVYLSEPIRRYIVKIVHATRDPQRYRNSLNEFPLAHLKSWIRYGASPRATIFLSRAARAQAFLNGKSFVGIDEVKKVAPLVLRHRLILTYEAEIQGITTDGMIQMMLEQIEVTQASQ